MLVLDHIKLSLDSFSLTADFSINAGTRVAVMGPSGAGKSSLLLAIAGFIAPTSGGIWLDGQNLTARDPAQRPVSVLFQDQNLFPH